MSSDDPPGSDLDHVVDDATPREESTTWAADQLVAGRAFETVQTELVESGWDDESAGAIVEEARQRTRDVRGVVTREQVARTIHANYRAAIGGGMLSAFPSIAAIRRLLFSIGTMKFLRKFRK